MNPIRRKINYVVVPIFLALTAAILTIMFVLMSIDEDKYLIAFFVLMAILVAILAALLISIPFTRKKEVAIELQKYDFDVKSAEPRDEYHFTYTELAATFPAATSPFEEFKNKNATFSGTDGLRELLDYYGVNLEKGKLVRSIPEYGEAIVSDYTENARYTNFYAETQADGELKVYCSHNLEINESGINVNGTHFDFTKANASVIMHNYLLQVHIYLNLLFDDEELSVSLRLSKEVLAMIEKFSIKVENREILDFILNDPKNAFEEILKRGKIPEKLLKKSEVK